MGGVTAAMASHTKRQSQEIWRTRRLRAESSSVSVFMASMNFTKHVPQSMPV